jgi:CYTH domain-containing protein
MGVEIERRFLVRGDAWRAAATRARRLRQGYLAREDGVTVRLRLEPGAARLTIKGPGGLVRPEFDYPLPPAEAAEMLDRLCAGRRLDKTRHDVPHGGLLWEVDVFEGPLDGLVIAEVELPRPDHPLELPPWAGREVTDDPRYANAALASAAAPPQG